MGHKHLEDQPIYTPPMQTPPIHGTPIIAPATPTSPPPTPTSPQPTTPSPTPQSAPTPSPSIIPPAPAGGGNGMVWCSGPQAPGWNVNLPDGGCSTTTKPNVVHLSQLGYTGNDSSDIEMSAAFYVLLIGLGLSGIGMLLKYKRWA
jgi:hypothetical protein